MVRNKKARENMSKSSIIFGSIILLIVLFLVISYFDGQRHLTIHASPAAVKYSIEHGIMPDSAMAVISKGAAQP
jgi:hypothetical protein